MATFLDYYNAPPTGQPTQTHLGSVNTADMAPSTTLSAEAFPRHIIGDLNLCETLLTFARNHLSAAPAMPAILPAHHQVAEDNINRAVVGDETVNMDTFSTHFTYVARFAELADRLPANSIQMHSCISESGIRPNRRICRNGFDRVVIEHKSIGAYNTHLVGIQNMASGQGTEIILSSHETGARSIILKLGRHMIFSDSRWGMLVAGTKFMIFFMKKTWQNGSCYHHMIASGSHQSFFPGPVQGIPGPCLSSVLIALLLHDDPTVSYPHPPATGVITPYIGDRSTRATRNTGGGAQSKALARAGSKTSKQSGRGTQSKTPARSMTMPSEQYGRPAVAIAGADATKELRSKTVLISGTPEALFRRYDGLQYCMLSFPNAMFPDLQIPLMRVSAQKAWDILVYQDANNNLPYMSKDGDITFCTDTANESALRVYGLKELGSGFCGSVHKSVCTRFDGSEEFLAVKFVTENFSFFWKELDVYEHLAGKPFVPVFYGAFAVQWEFGLQGVIIMEILEKVFESYSDMSMDQKRQALACLRQLHDMGYDHGDVRPSNFGISNGKVVILDFSHTEQCTHEFCFGGEILYLEKCLFCQDD